MAPSRGGGASPLEEDAEWQRKRLEEEVVYLRGLVEKLIECDPVELEPPPRPEHGNVEQERVWLEGETQRLLCETVSLCKRARREAAKLPGEGQEEVERLLAENKGLAADKNRFTMERERLSEDLACAEAERKRLEVAQAGIQQRMDELGKKSEESARLKAEGDRLQEENTQLRSERQNSAQELVQVKDEKSRLREEIEQLQAVHQISAQEIMRLKEENSRLLREHEQYQTERQSSAQEFSRLSEEHSSLLKVSEHLDSTSQQLAAENERLTEEFARVEHERDRLARLEAQARADAENHLERLAELSQENAELVKANADLRQEHDQLAEANQRLDSWRARLEEELSHSKDESRRLAELEQNARAEPGRHLQSSGRAEEEAPAASAPAARAAEAPVPAAVPEPAPEPAAALATAESSPRSSSTCSVDLVARRPSVPSTTSSMPQLVSSLGSRPLGSVPVLRDPPVMARRLSDPWVYSQLQHSSESGPSDAPGSAAPPPSAAASPVAPSSALLPPEPEARSLQPPGRGAPPLRPPVPLAPPAAAEDRALAAEAAAAFVRSLLKGRAEGAPRPAAAAASAERPAARLGPADAGGRGEEGLERRRRHSYQAPTRRFKMDKANTIGEVDEDDDEELEGAFDFATRHRSLPMAASELGLRRGQRRGRATGDAAKLEALVLGGRPRQPSDASGAPLSSRLEALKELRREPEAAARRPLLQGLFVLANDKLGSPCLQFRWPERDSHKQDPLEDAVVGKGFCPGVDSFMRGAGEPFVFSLLETALDPHGDPNGVLYGCVCGDNAVPEPVPRPTSGSLLSQASKAKAMLQRAMPYPTRKPQTAKDGALGNAPPAGNGWSLTYGSTPGAQASAVLCLVSRLPLFAFLFEILEILRWNPSSASELLERVNSVGFCERLVSEGVDLGGLSHVAQGFCLRLQLPRPLHCDWWNLCAGNGSSPWSPISRTVARWQVAWALSTMMARWDNLVGDTLARLLACTLLEQKVLLLGEVPCACAVALALRGLLWPFRWLHLFMSAPPPAELLDMPLFDGPFPLVICLSELPGQWGFRTPYELPPEAVAGILRHDYVHVSPLLETLGGLKGKALKLPDGRHAALLKQIVQAKQRLRKGDVDMQGAVELIQEAAEAEIARLAMLIKEYAAVQVEEAQRSLSSSAATNAASQKSLQEQCTEAAMQQEVFLSWLRRAKADVCTEEALPFFRTFFGTQLCLDLLYEELTAQVKNVSGAEPKAGEEPAWRMTQLQ